jgi:phenylalanyl-tRNA synthetase alpha chain
VRELGGDIIEEISKIDEFTNKKTNKTSHCYRIVYRSNDRSLTNEEVNEIQTKIRNESEEKLLLELR